MNSEKYKIIIINNFYVMRGNFMIRYNFENLDRILENIFKNFDLTGLAIGIVKGEEILYKKFCGVKNVETGEKVDENTIFNTASVSKVFVSTAIMILFEQGKIDLNGRVIDYLPYFKMKSKGYKEITIMQLLNHTSGMPDMEEDETS